MNLTFMTPCSSSPTLVRISSISIFPKRGAIIYTRFRARAVSLAKNAKLRRRSETEGSPTMRQRQANIVERCVGGVLARALIAST